MESTVVSLSVTAYFPVFAINTKTTACAKAVRLAGTNETGSPLRLECSLCRSILASNEVGDTRLAQPGCGGQGKVTRGV